MMRSTILTSALVAAALAFPVSVVRQGFVGAGGTPDPDATCTPTGAKCAGARNRAFVKYVGCCETDQFCGEPLEMPAGGWGLFCGTTANVKRVALPSGSASPTTATTAPPTDATTSASDVTTTAAASDATTSAADGATTVAGATTRAANATTTTKSDSVCFPASATVELEDGSIVSMDKISVGDSVKVGPNSFSKVFMFTHKMQTVSHEFVELTTASGATLSLTAGHYIPVDGALIAAAKVTVGSELRLGNGDMDKVVSFRNIAGTGLYNPQTLHGDIVVDGVVASTYTTAVEPRFAHAILSPFRSLFIVFGYEFTSLESGGGVLADMAPRGTVAF